MSIIVNFFFILNKNTLRYTRYKNMATLSQFRGRCATV